MSDWHYFAYGSNMSSARLRARIPGARRIGRASLAGYTLSFRKRGADGSAKLDVMPGHPVDDTVLGVLFTLDDAQKAVLDAIEGPGYEVVAVEVSDSRGGRIEAFMYRAVSIDPALRPFA